MFKMSEPKPEITSNMEPASAAALQSETNSESSEKAVNVEKNLPEEADLSAREIPQTSSLPVSLIPNPSRKSELSPGKKSNLTLSRDGSWNDRPTDSSPASMPNRSPCSDRASFKSNKLEDTRLARHHTSNETVFSQITNFRVWEYILSIVKHGSVMSHLGSGSAFVSEGKAMRGHWLGRFDCMISLMAASVGIGNFTHFPAKAHKHGAGTFLFPFIFVTCLVGVPIFYMEACLGQYSNYGAVMGWHMVPLFKGVGAGIGLTAAVMSVYYAVFVVYPIFYFGCSFKTPLPWAHCDNPWNSDACIVSRECMRPGEIRYVNGSCYSTEGKLYGVWNFSAYNNFTARVPTYSALEFWNEYIEGVDKSGDTGGPQGQLVACLFVVWLACFLALRQNISQFGSIMIFNVLIMILVLTVLVTNGALMPNSGKGLNYFFTPKWDNWLKPEVWWDASGEAFFGVILGTGVISTLCSYSRYTDGNPLKMSVLVITLDTVISIFAGIVLFTHMGNMAYRVNQPIESFARLGGMQLAYVVYPESLGEHKVAAFLSILFFWALAGLGLTSQIAFVQVTITMVLDAFPHWAKRKTVVVGTVCLLGFLLCLPFTIKGGNGWVQFVYGYVNGFCLLLNAVLEVIVVGWVYGADRFLDDIEAMIGRRPSNWWKVCWKFVVPICLVGLILWRLVDKGSKGADIINVCGWMMAFSPLFAVTFAMLYQLCRRPMVEPWPAKFQALLTPNGKWHRGNVPRPMNSINTVSNINDEFDAKTSLKEAWCRRENINKERLEAVSDSTLTSSTSGSTSLVLSVRDSRKKQRPRHVSILEVSEEMATSVRRFRDPASSGETSPKK